MSIAVSAIVRPSPRLRLLHACVLGSVPALVACGAGMRWPAAAFPASQLALLALCAGVAALLALRPAKARHLDISGVGQIRLTVYQGMARHSSESGGAAQALQLMAGSTLWPGLLVLRLRQAGGGVGYLLLLPDSVQAGAFRPLAVALRAIAARGGAGNA